MQDVMSRIDQALIHFVQAVIKRPGISLGAALLCVASLSAGMSFLYTDVTNESLFQASDPTLQQYQRFQAQFGRDDAIIAALASENIFTSDFFSKLEAFHKDLEASVPYLDLVTSLVSVTSVTDSGGDLLISDMVDIWPTTEAGFAQFKSDVISNPLYRDLIVSRDGSETLVIVRASAFATEENAPKSFRNTVISMHDRFRAFLESGDTEINTDRELSPPTGDQSDSAIVLDLSSLPSSVAMPTPRNKQDVNTKQTKPLTTNQLSLFVDAVREVAVRHQSGEFNIRLAGGQLIDAEHKDSIHADFASLIPLVFSLVFIVMYAVLRHWENLLLPLIVVSLSVLATIGSMGWVGSPITPVTVALPPLLLTVGVGASMHMLSVYLGEYGRSGEKELSLIFTIQRTGIPILLTSLTTAAGFLSFTLAELRSVSNFGFFAAFGVMLAFLLTLTVIPSIICLRRNSRSDAAFDVTWNTWVKRLNKITDYSIRRSKMMVGATFALILLSIPGVMQIQFSHDVLSWFPEDRPVRVNNLAVDKAFNGIIPLEFVVDTGTPNGIYSPGFMNKLDEFQRFAESLSFPEVSAGRATSVLDTLKRINEVINNDSVRNPIPSSEKLIAQELLLFESSGADDVEKLIDSQFSMARITVRLTWADALDYIPIRAMLENKAIKTFDGVATVSVTGTLDLVRRALVGVIQSMTTSYLIAATVIWVMLFLLLRSFSFSIIAMLPNLLPIFISLGIMGYAGIPITLFTVLLGGIALGIAVDDTVHFMRGYVYYRSELKLDLENSVKKTIQHTGPALLFTTVSIAIGFFIFMLSTNVALYYFGMLLGITIINALLADILLLPAMIKTLEQYTLLPLVSARTERAS